MKDKILHNLGLKILAVIFSAVLWVISININDPVDSNKWTVDVEILNMHNMENAGKYVEVLDGTDKVKVEVRASTSVLKSISPSNLIVTADLNELDENNQVPIDVSLNKTADTESIILGSKYVKVSVEDISKIQIPIDVVVQNKPAEGYMLGTTSTVQNAMAITGPESIVSRIESADVEINVEGATKNVNINLPVKLYDAEGVEINDSRLEKSVAQVSTTATILKTKTVSIEYPIIGEPEEGYMLTGMVDTNPATVLIAGTAEAVKNVNTIVVEGVLDVTNLKDNLKMEIDLKQYLPANVTLANDIQGLASVEVYIERIVTQEKNMNSNRIQIINMPNEFEGELQGVDDIVVLKVAGLQSDLNLVDEEDISGFIDIADIMSERDMTELKEGIYKANVVFELPAEVELKNEISVEVAVNRKKD